MLLTTPSSNIYHSGPYLYAAARFKESDKKDITEWAENNRTIPQSVIVAYVEANTDITERDDVNPELEQKSCVEATLAL